MTAVVTGLGLVTSFGIGAERFFAAAMAGRGPGRFRLVEPWGARGEERAVVAVDKEALAGALAGESRRTLNDESEMLLVAARGALADAGIEPGGGEPEAVGVAVSTRYAGLQDYAELFWRGAHDGRPVSPALGPQTGINGPAANVSIRLGAGGPNATFAGGAVGGIDALAWAVDAVERGDAAAMLACGVDVAPAAAAGLLPAADAPRTPRPFDAGRSGGVAAEAAVALVVEPEAARAARGPRAAIGGAVTAFSARGDLADAGERALRGALAATPWPAGSVAGCLAGAGGSIAGDAAEAQALDAVLAAGTPIAAVRGSLGDPAGAGGLVQLAAGCLSLEAGALPPTAGLTRFDPALPRLAVSPRPAALDAGAPLLVHCWDGDGAAAAVAIRGLEGER